VENPFAKELFPPGPLSKNSHMAIEPRYSLVTSVAMSLLSLFVVPGAKCSVAQIGLRIV
jgi:hypothetical protein